MNTDLTQLFDAPISDDTTASLQEFSHDELLRTGVILQTLLADIQLPPGSDNETHDQVDLLESLIGTLRTEAHERRMLGLSDHVVSAKEPLWLTAEHVADPETGRPMEVTTTDRDLIESLQLDAEYTCSCGTPLQSWSEVQDHLGGETPQ